MHATRQDLIHRNAELPIYAEIHAVIRGSAFAGEGSWSELAWVGTDPAKQPDLEQAWDGVMMSTQWRDRPATLTPSKRLRTLFAKGLRPYDSYDYGPTFVAPDGSDVASTIVRGKRGTSNDGLVIGSSLTADERLYCEAWLALADAADPATGTYAANAHATGRHDQF